MMRDKFKVIIIGGGPTGLMLAHALSLAGIDYVLFEQRLSIADKEGAGIAIMPHVVRILHQLGLLEAAEKLAPPMYGSTHVDAAGRGWRENGIEVLHHRHGYRLLLFERYQLMRLLEEALPERQRHIRTGMTLKSISEDETGVTATFQDGTVEEASIIVGADGVHSTIRSLMSKMSPRRIDPNLFASQYWGLYGQGASPDGIRDGEVVERFGDKWAIQTLSRGDRSFFFIYAKLEKPSKGRQRFTSSDTAKFVEPFMETLVIEGVKFRDFWDRRDLANLRYLEEGIAKEWSQGRIALAGDAVHKVMPNLGVGGNMGMESAVCLANQLRQLLDAHHDPDTRSISRAFQDYQERRQGAAGYWLQIGHAHMQLLTLESEKHRERVKSQVASSGIQEIEPHFAPGYSEVISRGMIMDYVPLKAEKRGSMPWASDVLEVPAAPRARL